MKILFKLVEIPWQSSDKNSALGFNPWLGTWDPTNHMVQSKKRKEKNTLVIYIENLFQNSGNYCSTLKCESEQVTTKSSEPEIETKQASKKTQTLTTTTG